MAWIILIVLILGVVCIAYQLGKLHGADEVLTFWDELYKDEAGDEE